MTKKAFGRITLTDEMAGRLRKLVLSYKSSYYYEVGAHEFAIPSEGGRYDIYVWYPGRPVAKGTFGKIGEMGVGSMEGREKVKL